MEENGAVINTTISLYSHATLIKRIDYQINVYSKDLDETYHAENLTEALSTSNNFKLILSVIKLIHPEYGFDLYLHSDFPIKSGLGGSAVVASSILGCFNQFRTDKWDQYEMAELAYQAERLYLDIAGGWVSTCCCWIPACFYERYIAVDEDRYEGVLCCCIGGVPCCQLVEQKTRIYVDGHATNGFRDVSNFVSFFRADARYGSVRATCAVKC